MWAIAVIKKEDGDAIIFAANPPYSNASFMGDLPGVFGLYLVSDTQARLIAADSIAGVYGICLLTDDGTVKWAQLENTITPAMRTKINSYLTAHGYPTIPAGWTNRQAVKAILNRINPDWRLEDFWVKEK